MTIPVFHSTFRGVGALLALAVGAVPLAAQSGVANQIEVGTFGLFTKYDNSNLGFGNEFGAGGRIGYYLSDRFSLEAAGDYTETATTALNRKITAARVGATLFAKASVFHFGAGIERMFYRSAQNFDDTGIHVVIGPRLSLGGRAGFRFEGRATYIPSSNAPGASGSAFNLGASAGLSIYSFGGEPRDADKDGVGASLDDCPDTPLGARVDEAGCPSDEDDDGVFDGLDDCPATVAAADVDWFGCPTDTDLDGVFNGIDICPDTPADATVNDNGCPTDADADGVFDGIDQCADTPVGALVDVAGCPSDEDADGVFDGIDQCAATPQGTMVTGLGCPRDDDLDGVINDLDQCPNTPPDTEVNETGCVPDVDTDLDGIVDRMDRCPNTAPGTNVDNVGCPVLFVFDEATERTTPLILQGVQFASGSANLTSGSFAALDLVAASLLGNPEVRIEIGGHTDATGSTAANQRVSLARAEAVRAYLAQQGVPIDRMEARGYGPDQPIATNGTAAGRSQNRRVELRRIDQ